MPGSQLFSVPGATEAERGQSGNFSDENKLAVLRKSACLLNKKEHLVLDAT